MNDNNKKKDKVTIRLKLDNKTCIHYGLTPNGVYETSDGATITKSGICYIDNPLRALEPHNKNIPAIICLVVGEYEIL